MFNVNLTKHLLLTSSLLEILEMEKQGFNKKQSDKFKMCIINSKWPISFIKKKIPRLKKKIGKSDIRIQCWLLKKKMTKDNLVRFGKI